MMFLGNNNYRVIDGDEIITVRDNDCSSSDYTADKNVFLKIKVFKRNVDKSVYSLCYPEFDGLRLVLDQMVERLDVASGSILHGTNITEDHRFCQKFRGDKAVKSHLTCNFAVAFTVNLGDYLCAGNF